MDLYEAINTRCSIRQFLTKAIEPDKLNRVLEAGRIAPSGSNKQDHVFVVVTDQAVRAQLGEASQQSFVGDAPVVIAVVGINPSRIMKCAVPSDPVNCAIAIDHMTLAAVAEGLGTCWIGHFDQDQARAALGVPANCTIIELLPLGYPDQPPRPKQRKALSDLVRYNRFS